MPRPIKEGLDYFPIDLNMDSDDKIYMIEASHGLVGFAIIIKLLMEIYRNGYYYKWTEKEQLIFSGKKRIELEVLLAVIGSALKWEFFSKKMYAKYHILTSRGIQKRYAEATKKRKATSIIDEYCLLNEETSINDESTPVDSAETCIDSSLSTQRKVKERKGKNTMLEAPKKALPVVKAPPSESLKKANPYYKPAVDHWFALWRDKYNVKGSWGKKEGMLLNQDLKKLEGNEEFSALEIIKQLMEMFLGPNRPKSTEWLGKEDYAAFHSSIDYLLKECNR